MVESSDQSRLSPHITWTGNKAQNLTEEDGEGEVEEKDNTGGWRRTPEVVGSHEAAVSSRWMPQMKGNNSSCGCLSVSKSTVND